MDLNERKKRQQKAKNFIDSGKPISVEKRSAPSKPKQAESKNKKHATYYLDIDLIQKILIRAAQNNERPCHFMTRAAEQLLQSEPIKNLES